LPPNGIFILPLFRSAYRRQKRDIVVIATPNEFHKPLSIAAMAAGKHVISEKPVTLSSADLQEIIDASKKYGKNFSCHQNRALTPISRWFANCTGQTSWAKFSESNQESRVRAGFRRLARLKRTRRGHDYSTGACTSSPVAADRAG
jgi:MinD superfamily P-loop ATPase